MTVTLTKEVKKAWKSYKNVLCNGTVTRKDRRDFLTFIYPKIKAS